MGPVLTLGRRLVMVFCVSVPLIVCMPKARPGPLQPDQDAAARVQSQSGPVPMGPAKHVDIGMPRVEGHTIKVAGGGDLQSALNAARPGDEVSIQPGAEFKGNFVLPKKDANQNVRWITITTQSAELPGAGTRITPASAGLMPKLVSINAAPALAAAPGAGGYRIIGIEITADPAVKSSYGAVRLGEGSETAIDQLPHDIIIDRCFIHGLPTANMRRGIALNCAQSAVINSYISDCHEVGADSQAICCWNGPGPFEISNNYLEAAGENVMFGGADPHIVGLIPSDVEFKNNYCRKPLSWRMGDPAYAGTRWGVKNLFELKNGRRFLIEDNVFENNWLDAQTGYAILFKSVNQDGHAPWSLTKDIVFRHNSIRHVSSAVNIQGKDPNQESGRTASIAIDGNLFDDVDGKKWGGEGTFVKITDTADVHVDHNTVSNKGSIIIAYGPPSGPFTFTNNIVYNNSYGIKGDGTATGIPTLEKYFNPYLVAGNAIIGGKASDYPRGNCFELAGQVQISEVATRESAKCRGTDGAAAGCDLNAINVVERRETASGR
jgi:hypothetical protein